MFYLTKDKLLNENSVMCYNLLLPNEVPTLQVIFMYVVFVCGFAHYNDVIVSIFPRKRYHWVLESVCQKPAPIMTSKDSLDVSSDLSMRYGMVPEF